MSGPQVTTALDLSRVSSHWLSRVLLGTSFGLLLVIVVAAPLPWGSNRPWSWYPLEIALYIAFLLAALGVMAGPDLVSRPGRTENLACGFLAAFLLYILFQTVPVPSTVLKLFSPHTAEIYGVVPGATGSISVDRGATLSEFLKYAAYGAGFMGLLWTITTRRRLKWLLWCLIGSGIFQALFGMYSAYTGLRVTPLELMDGHFNLVIGTFINRNHYSAYIACVIALTVGLIVAKSRHKGGIRASGLPGALDTVGGQTGLLAAILIILFTALMFSASRGAIGALGLALLTTAALGVVVRRHRGTELSVLILVCAALAISVLWFGIGGLGDRIQTQGLTMSARVSQWGLSAQLVRDFWLTGTGAGTYVLTFAGYQSEPLLDRLVYDHAHSDYIEALAEYGILGAVLLGLFVAAVLWRLITRYSNRRDQFYRGVLFGSIGALLVFLIHAFVEFNFRIPANALMFFSVAAIGLVAAKLPHEDKL